MSDNEKHELRVRSDDLVAELAHLKETEALKRREAISTPRYHALSDDVTASSRRIFAIALEQDELGEEAETGAESIDDVDPAG